MPDQVLIRFSEVPDVILRVWGVGTDPRKVVLVVWLLKAEVDRTAPSCAASRHSCSSTSPTTGVLDS
ncbi:unnamed protein product [Zymoseptoria tritici ST99CH_3D7]|uniref:Uncharacterized protein n=1 Tax=Zymoseptoria tritici (strain ST99CH_3D7) TaxID=1276538 RepID=A0A1X7S1F6_ZYMT9|nr:unnamed protein product [Zymoseptoria tritici ST99CH_3D7]